MDDCSQPTLISDVLVKRYRLPTSINPDSEPVYGVGFDNVNTSRVCYLKLVSRVNSFEINVRAEVIPAAAIRYAVNSISWKTCPDRFQEIKHLKLADPAFYDESPTINNVDILLGAEFAELCKLNETVRINQLTLRNTQFGWTFIGAFPAKQTSDRACFLTTRASIINIDAQLYRFWEVENITPANKPIADADHCEKHFVATTTRDENGKFVVCLPFTAPPSTLAPNCVNATRIFLNAEKRHASAMKKAYVDFMAEYESLGHMTKVESSNQGYFIPHHAVLKPSSTTTQTRVVFNASFKTTSNQSLNDILMIGPQLQPDLFSALIRFRSYLIAITADVSKMYRCVWVHPEDRQYQKIIWRTSPDVTLAEYELNTITYGTAPASFLATRCLKAIADSIHKDHPAAAKAIERHFYMDDLLTGAESCEEADALRNMIHSNLANAGFELRKYQSNSRTILDCIPAELVETKPLYEFGDAWAISILGLFWEPMTDTLRIRETPPKISESSPITKRQVLSEISKVFDPLGLASPFTIRAKLFLQKVWKEGIQWDENVSDSLAGEVRSYFSEFPTLSNFAVPRPYATTQAVSKSLIGFCDASDKAYCASLYLRQIDANHRVSCQLICAKTRVAPLKALTIPRLELQGALLLAELVEKVSPVLEIQRRDVFLYSDPEVTRAWLAKPDFQWDVFVKNRVQKISALFPYEHWSYVHTKENPADLGTRGVSAQFLTKSNLWSSGPPLLLVENFFRNSESPTEFHTTMEIKRTTKVCHQVTSAESGSIVDRFSNYKRLIAVIGRVILWVRKWHLTRPDKAKYFSDTSLSACLSSARTVVIRLLQAPVYHSEIEALRQSKPIPAKSTLRHLDPFLDDEGILRVRGRLQNSKLSYARKYPIILPKNCHFLKIYADYIHHSFCHANKEFVQRFILAEFYPAGSVNQLLKSRLRKCLTCIRFKAEGFRQFMGQLPEARVNVSRPFTHTGVDFCGPFNSRCLGHRTIKFNKIYACIFVCMCTRVVHIEVASDLSSTIFLMAFHRFAARRGVPAVMYSDRGTNFIGAKNYLDLEDESIQRDAGIKRIQWRFNPPRTPHRGGLWEAAVKSAKSHLQRVILDQPLNFEEYTTIFHRIEGILNSRPLCYRRSTTSQEDFVLTPNHFLIRESPHLIPEPESADRTTLPLIARYNFVRSIINGFWKFWRSDYLNMLQRREKWLDRCENIRVGQIVLVKLPSSPIEWPLPKIIAVHPDADNQIRTVTVKFKDNSRCVDIRSLIKLPVDNEQ